MIRSELRDDRCSGCGASLAKAASVERESVTFAGGEYAGDPGVVLVVRWHCGRESVIPLSVSPEIEREFPSEEGTMSETTTQLRPRADNETPALVVQCQEKSPLLGGGMSTERMLL